MNTIAVVCLLSLFTVIDAVRNPCKDATFGGCNMQNSIRVLGRKQVQTIQLCNEECFNTDNCDIYRYNRENKECTLTTIAEKDYRAVDCDTIAGPVDNDPFECFGHIWKQICDSYLEEGCEYSGENVRAFRPGGIGSLKDCWDMCVRMYAPDCKYWIYHKRAHECILKRDGRKTCTGWGGPKEPSFDHCKNLTMSSHAL